ncbi:MAG: hypothetical protein GY869_27135, partial [Planctomycetes bacterium]|nr:hypothetical protein [Planctomycetota bacterium]
IVDMGSDEFYGILVPLNYPTIQSAISAASEGDIIAVGPGTYFENIDFFGKAVMVMSTDDLYGPIIDGSQAGSVITFQNGEGPGSVLDGFGIVNGSALNGGGILCNGASPVLRCNYITNNITLSGDGGGIYCINANPTIAENTLYHNNAINGGGICCNQSSPEIKYNT